jgi:indole-3-acetaldehyde oxidase
MGKEAAAAALSSTTTVVLAVNGKRYEAAGVDPSMSLLEFLRTQTPVRGPKLGCGEGMYVYVMSERHC